LESIVLFLLGMILALIGLIGMLFPAIPGAPILLGGLVIAAWADDFVYVQTPTIVILTLLAAVSYVLDFLAGAFGVKRFGASPRAMVGAMIGAIAGFFFGLIGILIGPFIGASVGELSVARDLRAAGRAGIGATVGLALGAAAKLALAFAMLGIFAFARFF
jgi:uncharacterized protein YqgC (DUF456 family)